MTETLQEFCDWRAAAMRVDREAGVIRGVKILGLDSRNGRSYLPEALTQAAALYEDAKVNVNHPKNHPAGPRDYQDRIGMIRNVSVRPDGLFADFSFNPKHPLAEQLVWDAEHASQNVGFSHNVEARTARRGDRTVVEAITRVQSVDLVADPATTRGLFESCAAAAAARGQAADRPQLTLEDLRRDYPELVAALAGAQESELRQLRAEVDRLTLLEAVQRKQQLLRRLLREYRLPEPESADAHARTITSPRFVESLLAAADEPAMRSLLEERAALVRSLGGDSFTAAGKPVSCDQHCVDGRPRIDTRTFVEAITGSSGARDPQFIDGHPRIDTRAFVEAIT